MGGMPPTADPEPVGRTLQVLQPLLLHPEPLVWVHAARARALDWAPRAAPGHAPRLGPRRVEAPSPARVDGLRVAPRRALHAGRGAARGHHPLARRGRLVLAAIAAATPYLFFERRISGIASRRASSRATAERSLRARWREGSPRSFVADPRARPTSRHCSARCARWRVARGRARSTTRAAGSRSSR